MRIKLRYRWCGSPPCFDNRTEKPDFRVKTAAKKLGWTPGLKGERVYSDIDRAVRDAAILLLHGYDVWLEPQERRKTSRTPQTLGVIHRLDRLASMLSKARSIEEALEASEKVVAEFLRWSIEEGYNVDNLVAGDLEPLIDVYELILRALHARDEKLLKTLEAEKPWLHAAWSIAPWRAPLHKLFSMTGEKTKAILEKIRGLITRRA